MFKKILLPLDGSAMSERAIDAAEEMAKGSGAEVLLLKVVPSPLGKAPEAGQAEETKAFTESVDRSKAYLEKFAARLAGKSVKSRILVPSGEPYAEILAAAHKEDVDCIVMSTHGGTALARVLLGSTAETGGVHHEAAGHADQAERGAGRASRRGRGLRRRRKVDPSTRQGARAHKPGRPVAVTDLRNEGTGHRPVEARPGRLPRIPVPTPSTPRG